MEIPRKTMLSVLPRVFCCIVIVVSALAAQTLPERRAFWDDVFRNGKVAFNKDASKLLQYAVWDRKPGTAIDLGMGEGRNAVFLASKGWQVTGVDFSEEAVKQAKARASAAHLPLTAVIDDLDHFDLGRSKWDLIALFYMHAWFHESKLDVPQRLMDALRPGGLLLIEGYAGDKGDYQTDELLRDFSDLKITHYEDVSDEADWNPGRKSRIVRFIAEKPTLDLGK
jgi:SAM-dependent methyltransferase